jgi:hypothetical protein
VIVDVAFRPAYHTTKYVPLTVFELQPQLFSNVGVESTMIDTFRIGIQVSVTPGNPTMGRLRGKIWYGTWRLKIQESTTRRVFSSRLGLRRLLWPLIQRLPHM